MHADVTPTCSTDIRAPMEPRTPVNFSLVPRPSSGREERGRVWNITPGGSVPKECCAQVIMECNLAFVVSHAYKECKLRSILLKCTRARAVHAASLGTFYRPFKYSGLTPCIVANQHLSRNFCLLDTSAQGYVPDPPSFFSRIKVPFNCVGVSVRNG